MAKGYEEHQQRLGKLSMFGKDLARRSGSCCELCNTSGTKLSVFEVPPSSSEPEYERCVFLCDICRGQIENPRTMDPNHWRCLNKSIWSPVPAVQVMAIRMLETLASTEGWANDLLEQIYLDPEVRAWADAVK